MSEIYGYDAECTRRVYPADLFLHYCVFMIPPLLSIRTPTSVIPNTYEESFACVLIEIPRCFAPSG